MKSYISQYGLYSFAVIPVRSSMVYLIMVQSHNNCVVYKTIKHLVSIISGGPYRLCTRRIQTYLKMSTITCAFRADSRLTPSQWETALPCNDVSHRLSLSLESALALYIAKPIFSEYYCFHAGRRLRNFFVVVSDQKWPVTRDQFSDPGFRLCAQYQGYPSASATVTVPCSPGGLFGRYVYISLPSTQWLLTICELEVGGGELVNHRLVSNILMR